MKKDGKIQTRCDTDLMQRLESVISTYYRVVLYVMYIVLESRASEQKTYVSELSILLDSRLISRQNMPYYLTWFSKSGSPIAPFIYLPWQKVFMNLFCIPYEWVFMLITSVFMNSCFLRTFFLVPWRFIKTDFYCKLTFLRKSLITTNK